MFTKNKNVWIILALSLFLSPTLALAQDDVEDATSTTSMVRTTPVSDLKINLKWKIDWNYKVVFNWNDIKSSLWDDFKDYILVLSYTQEPAYPNTSDQQVFTVSDWKNETLDYHAKAWINYYRVFWITESWTVYASNTVKIAMDWNWRPVYDVNYWSTKSLSWALKEDKKYRLPEWSGAYKEDKKYRLPEWTWSLYLSWMTNDELKQKREELKNKFKEQKELTSSWVKAIKDENKQKVEELKFDLEKLKMSLNLTDAQVASLKELRTKLESDLKYLKKHITSTNLEEIKAKYETLKTDYLAKVEEIAPWALDLKKIIENRFEIFNQNQFITREKVSELKDAAKTTTQEIKNEIKAVKSDLVSKYKTKYLKQLWTKLDNYDTEKLNQILQKLQNYRETVVNNTWITETKKTSILAQIDALVSIIKDKLDTSSDDLNLDEIIN